MSPAPKKMAVNTIPRSLLEFMRDKRKATCQLCALPDAVRAELNAAREKKIPREVQKEWLKAECGISVTSQEMDFHRLGRHDIQ